MEVEALASNLERQWSHSVRLRVNSESACKNQNSRVLDRNVASVLYEALRAAAAAAASSLQLLATSDGSIDLGVDRSTKLF
jgi:hypothetical protein